MASDILISFALFQIRFPSISYLIRTLHLHYFLFDSHFLNSSLQRSLTSFALFWTPHLTNPYLIRTFWISSPYQFLIPFALFNVPFPTNFLFDSHFFKSSFPPIPYLVRTFWNHLLAYYLVPLFISCPILSASDPLISPAWCCRMGSSCRGEVWEFKPDRSSWDRKRISETGYLVWWLTIFPLFSYTFYLSLSYVTLVELPLYNVNTWWVQRRALRQGWGSSRRWDPMEEIYTPHRPLSTAQCPSYPASLSRSHFLEPSFHPFLISFSNS